MKGSAVWEPLSDADYFIVAFVGVCQALALFMCVHLVWCRKWPPYVTKNVNLVVITVSAPPAILCCEVNAFRYASLNLDYDPSFHCREVGRTHPQVGSGNV